MMVLRIYSISKITTNMENVVSTPLDYFWNYHFVTS